MIGPEFRPHSFRHSISSPASVPLPLRSTSVKLKLPSVSASWASSGDETAMHWNPRARRKLSTPTCVAASTSATRARRCVIGLLLFFSDQSVHCETQRQNTANAIPDAIVGLGVVDSTDLSAKKPHLKPPRRLASLSGTWVV